MEPRQVYMPFGEFLPDKRYFGQTGLFAAHGVVPVSGDGYMPSPGLEAVGGQDPTLTQLAATPYGMGLAKLFVSGQIKTYAYFGTATKLYEIDIKASTSGLVQTDRSRLAGGAYAFIGTPPQDFEMWWFSNYGSNVIATNFNDEVQYLPVSGTGNFADMITSTWKPQARFAFPIRQNLFLAYVFSPALYDTVTAGTHPQLVAWSMNDNLRSYGSENVDPALIGAGYNPLNNDFGPITAGIGGDYGLVFQVNGIVRIDGPPYEFRAIVEGDSTLYPYSVFRMDGDVYFWGNGGPSVLRGGEAPVIQLGDDKFIRSLLDNRTTRFGLAFCRNLNLPPREVSGGGDGPNHLVRFSYLPAGGTGSLADDTTDPDGELPTLDIDYNIAQERAAVSRSPTTSAMTGVTPQTYFQRTTRPIERTPWGPFTTVYGLARTYSSVSTLDYWNLVRVDLEPESGSSAEPVPVQLQTGFGQIGNEPTSRILAVRPIMTGNTVSLGDLSVTIHSRVNPRAATTSRGPFTVSNEDGWIGTDDAILAGFHSIEVVVETPSEIDEIEGIEIMYVPGGTFGA